MRILTVDVGTGTQDILLFDADREIENCFKLVLPSPTVIVAEQVRAATAARQRVVLSGSTMGGGPCHWAALEHVRAGLELFATPGAAGTFDDDLTAVAEMGVSVVSIEEAEALARGGATRVHLRDLWLDGILDTFERFGISTRLDALAVAAFDHGAAPSGYSDRVFRFNYLRRRLSAGLGLAGFAFAREDVPAEMTRLRAVAADAPEDLPMLLMDTAPAAVLGALEDPMVSGQANLIVANVGNFHCLAFHLVEGSIAGLFEHHTGELTPDHLGLLVRRLGSGDLTNEEVFATKGHGALILQADVPEPSLLAVTGPRRALLALSGLHHYQAVPHGDMMLAGNFGLMRAYAAQDPAVQEVVERRLNA